MVQSKFSLRGTYGLKILVHVNVLRIVILQNSSLVPVLRDALREYNLTLSGSTSSDLCHLPPASLQRFVRGKNTACAGGSSDFQGSVLATFNHTFTNRYACE